MRRYLLLGLLAAPSGAHAMGVGTTGWVAGPSFGAGFAGSFFGGGYLPTLDLYPTSDVRIGIHALDTLAWLFEDSDLIYLGANVTVTALRVDSFEGFDGVIQPGGSLDIYSNFGSTIVIGGLTRFGFEGGGTMQGGVYLVPGLGIVAGDGDEGAVWSGRLEFSLWFGNPGKGGGGGGDSLDE
jgi:hypothetical protein